MMYDILQLNDMLVPELKDIAAKLKLPNYKKLSKQDLIYKILDEQALKNKHTVKDEDLESQKSLPKTMPMEAGPNPEKKSAGRGRKKAEPTEEVTPAVVKEEKPATQEIPTKGK
jgi:transcription termination factor Rho